MEIKHFAQIKYAKELFCGGENGAPKSRWLWVTDKEIEIPCRTIESVLISGIMSISIYDRTLENGVYSEPINPMPTVYFGYRLPVDATIRAFRGAAGSSELYEAKEAGYEYICLTDEAMYFPMDKNGLTYEEYLRKITQEQILAKLETAKEYGGCTESMIGGHSK